MIDFLTDALLCIATLLVFAFIGVLLGLGF